MPDSVKSVQYIEITIGHGAISNSATINPVNIANSVVVYLGVSTTILSQAPDDLLTRVELSNSTTVTASRIGFGQDATTSCAIIEFEAAVVKSKQSGTILISSASYNTATITPVNTAKSLLFYCGSTTNYTSNNYPRHSHGRLDLTNSTTVTASRGGAGVYQLTLGWNLIEFN